jgi:ABC-type oligopeptide transport system substrate-binding subunit/DNA-binding SARP family transcriptional activator
MNDRLEIHTLGRLLLQIGDKSVTGLVSRKAAALLIYLAANSRPYSREVLADMLWDDRSQSQAMANLRVALSSLRKEVGEYVNITREKVGMNTEANTWLDAIQFEQELAPLLHSNEALSPEQLEQATQVVALYQGDFLEGVYLRECRRMEDWIVRERERLHHMVVAALSSLVTHALHSGDYQPGLKHVQRLLELDPLMEAGHRQMMRLLALSGQRGAALAQFETCQRILQDELGVQPEAATVALFKQIQQGDLPAAREALPMQAPRFPPFLSEEIEEKPQPPFVVREVELARLDEFLELAISGQGQVAFIAGDAGSGKTSLLRGFARHVQDKYPQVLLTMGECNAFSGLGDPYLPFRELLEMLTGDLESRLATQAIGLEGARRLWSALPVTLPALLEHGQGLLEGFLSASALAARLRLAASTGELWDTWLREIDQIAKTPPDDQEQLHLSEEFTRVVMAISQQSPLVLVLDDLQWADAGSTDLLFHLARRLEGNPLLILAAYRPEEILTIREGESTPLEKLLHEFKRQFGEVWIDLNASREERGSQFVSDLLDSQSNQLTATFRQALFQRTGGHPLFTVEMLRILQEQGGLVKDQNRVWRETHELNWEVMPARVEGVIEARLARLEPELQELLRTASLMGEQFRLHVLAHLTGRTEASLAHLLGEQLDRRHRLVQEQGARQIGNQRDYLFRFRHALFQQHLYQQVGEAERRLLHGQIGKILEELYAGHTDQVTVQLAWHYTEAGQVDKAVEYLLQAGDQARALYAHQEAIDHYQRALKFLKDQHEYERAARTLMNLGLTYHTAFDFNRSRQTYQEGFALWQRADMSASAGLPPPQKLRIGGSEPLTLDPTLGEDLGSFIILDQLFSGLITLSPEMEVLPDVASSWEVTHGGLKYIFHLREDVVWSDGKPVTSADFEFAWKRVLDPATRSPIASILYDIKGAQAFHQGLITNPDLVGVQSLDDHMLVVDLEGPAGYFLYLLASTLTYHPVPRHIVELHRDRWTDVENIVTNGPFRLMSWNRGVSLSLEHNPSFHGQFKGNVHQIEYFVNLEPSESLTLYEQNKLDLLPLSGMGWFPASAQTGASRKFANDYISWPVYETQYVDFNTSRPPFNDRRVRRAFVMAIDRAWWINEGSGGMNFPATGGFIPPGMPGHSPGIGLPHDPDQARRLLAQAGYPNGDGFPPTTTQVPSFSAISCDLLLRHWQNVLGVEIASEVMEWGAYLDRVRTQYPPIIFMAWQADYPDPDNFLRLGLSSYSQGKWRNEAYTERVEKARRISNQDKRIELYRQADRILIEEAVILPLSYPQIIILLKPWVKRFPVTPQGSSFWKNVIIEPH